MKSRLDQEITRRGLVESRSQAENWVKLGKVSVDGVIITKPGYFVSDTAEITLTAKERYVSRAGLKLASVAQILKLDFANKVVLDVGSSTGGFTDYALQHGASKVYAVDVGTDQLHPSLRSDKRVELYEKTDIRDFIPDSTPDIVVIDVSFISLRDILSHIRTICGVTTEVIAMAKPQFEATPRDINKGVIKNDTLRRDILKRLEDFLRQDFVVLDKADSDITGAKGNRERFYKLKRLGT